MPGLSHTLLGARKEAKIGPYLASNKGEGVRNWYTVWLTSLGTNG